MKIDEATINHNASRIIRTLVKTSYEVIEQEGDKIEREYVLMTIGEIAGVIDMAKMMREVLKV